MNNKPPPKTDITRAHISISDKVQLVIWCNEHKDKIQERLNRGVSFAQIAGEKGAPLYTMKEILKSIGVTFRHGGNRSQSVTSSAILTVLARVCSELNIDHDEIKEYL